MITAKPLVDLAPLRSKQPSLIESFGRFRQVTAIDMSPVPLNMRRNRLARTHLIRRRQKLGIGLFAVREFSPRNHRTAARQCATENVFFVTVTPGATLTIWACARLPRCEAARSARSHPIIRLRIACTCYPGHLVGATWRQKSKQPYDRQRVDVDEAGHDEREIRKRLEYWAKLRRERSS